MFRCEGTSWQIAVTDVNTPMQKAGISLNKTWICCKLKNVVAFTLRRLAARLVNGTYVDISSLPRTAIGQGRQE